MVAMISSLIIFSLLAVIIAICVYFYIDVTAIHTVTPLEPFTIWPNERALETSMEESDRILLVCVGEVFDVTLGKAHYGKDSAYSTFVGRDDSRAFTTGNFGEEGVVRDMSDLSPSDCLDIFNWLNFYKNDEKYPLVGKLAGIYYDTDGSPLIALKAFHKCVENGLKNKNLEEEHRNSHPNCNSRWTKAEGGRVWCKDPAKVPRKVTVNGREMCSCYEVGEAIASQASLQGYDSCDPTANLCVTTPGMVL